MVENNTGQPYPGGNHAPILHPASSKSNRANSAPPNFDSNALFLYQEDDFYTRNFTKGCLPTQHEFYEYMNTMTQKGGSLQQPNFQENFLEELSMLKNSNPGLLRKLSTISSIPDEDCHSPVSASLIRQRTLSNVSINTEQRRIMENIVKGIEELDVSSQIEEEQHSNNSYRNSFNDSSSQGKIVLDQNSTPQVMPQKKESDKFLSIKGSPLFMPNLNLVNQANPAPFQESYQPVPSLPKQELQAVFPPPGFKQDIFPIKQPTWNTGLIEPLQMHRPVTIGKEDPLYQAVPTEPLFKELPLQPETEAIQYGKSIFDSEKPITLTPQKPLGFGIPHPPPGLGSMSPSMSMASSMQLFPEENKVPFGESEKPSMDKETAKLVENAYRLSKDQTGCRMLQSKLDENDPILTSAIFKKLIPNITEHMNDPFGNYLCQKLFENLPKDELELVMNTIQGSIVQISNNLHGTRAIQKLIEQGMKIPELEERAIHLTRTYVSVLVQDVNGNHVIQKCLCLIKPPVNQFIYDEIMADCIKISTHKHGCCVMQKCLDYASPEQKQRLIDRIVSFTSHLVRDAYGNYVIQYVIDQKDNYVNGKVAQYLLGNIYELSNAKFSSNVIEKSLEHNEYSTKAQIIAEILLFPSYYEMLINQYGNYVIQKALQEAKEPHYMELIKRIKGEIPLLKKSNDFGRKIFNKLIKSFPELADRQPKPQKKGKGKDKRVNYQAQNYTQAGYSNYGNSYYQYSGRRGEKTYY